VKLIEIMAAGRHGFRKSDAFVGAFLLEWSYLSPFFHRRRALWATTVALACGVIGVAAILFAVLTGQKLDRAPSQGVVDPGLAELWYDFAALQGAGTSGGTAEAGFVPAPEPVNTGTVKPPSAGQLNKRCTQGTWPFFDNDCLWANTADSGPPQRLRKRIVARLKSPWCSSLRSNDGAYFCRPRS
jgi:hypothetical protein